MKHFAALLFVCPVFAASPVLTDLQPRGAEIGRPFTLTLVGRDIPDAARLVSTLPASFTVLVPSQKPGTMAAPGRAVAFLIEPKPEATPGIYPVRIETPSGISNVLLFSLGAYPEVTEEESKPYAQPHSNDSIETAEPVRSTPVVVNGTLRGPERDVFRISGKAGERRVFEIEARRCGSAVDPVLRILDAKGRQLARGDDSPGIGLDTRLDFTFPAEGNYYVEVTDARYSTQTQNFYRLKMGSYRYPDGIFPLGGRRGEQVPVTFFGKALAAPVRAAIDLRRTAKTEDFAPAALPDSPALPLTFAVSDLPERLEPVEGAVALPVVLNGRLDKPGEIDRYRLQVEPGQKLLLELQARELETSRLEGIIIVYDPSGKKLDSAGDQPLPDDVFAIQGNSRTSRDPFLNLTVPADIHELTVTVEDLAQRGGPLYGYRLIARQLAEDFHLTINSPYLNIPAGGTAAVNVTADRRGYDGPIQLTVANLPKGIRAEGGIIPREYVDSANARTINRRGVLLLTADPGVQLPPTQLEVWGDATLADNTSLRRQARGPGIVVDVAGATEQGAVDFQRPVTAPWLDFHLPAGSTAKPPASLSVHLVNLKPMEEGVRYEYEYQWTVEGKANPPARISVNVIGAKDIRIIDMTKTTFAVTTTKATDPGRYDLYVNGRFRPEEGEIETIYSRPIPFEVTNVSK